MTKAVKIDHWRSVNTSELLERRQYKNGRVRFYMKKSYHKTWHRVDKDLAEEQWLPKKMFISHLEYLYRKDEDFKDTMLKVKLKMAQRIGGFKPKWGTQVEGTIYPLGRLRGILK